MSPPHASQSAQRRSRSEAHQLAAEFEAGAAPREEFCKRHGISLASLARYRKHWRQAQEPASNAERWLSVEVTGRDPAGASSGLAVVLAGGRRIEIGRGFDAPTLQQAVRTLEQL
jgi:hypothetical protein